jgi:hypothetical protein
LAHGMDEAFEVAGIAGRTISVGSLVQVHWQRSQLKKRLNSPMIRWQRALFSGSQSHDSQRGRARGRASGVSGPG